jgi:hypothetical protein
MATTNITVKHRPNRIGFLVRPGELADLERAASLCSLIWGGLRNPIIPVEAKDDPAADEIIRKFQIDVLIAVDESDTIKQFVERYPYLVHPQMSARGLLRQDWNTKKNKVAYLDVLNAVERYWERDFKHAPKEYESDCRLITWDESDRLNEVFSLSFGRYPTNLDLQHEFRAAFLNGLRAKEISVSAHGNVDATVAGTLTPMRLTGIDLQGHQGSFRSWVGGVYFGDAKNFSDLITFWNLRASGGEMEFASLPDLGRVEDFIKTHLKRLDDVPDRHPNLENHIAICFRDHHDQIMAVLPQFPTKKRKLLCHCDSSLDGGPIGSPATFCFNWDFSAGFVEHENGRYTVTLPLPEKPFIVNSQRSLDDQSMAVSRQTSAHICAEACRNRLLHNKGGTARFRCWQSR